MCAELQIRTAFIDDNTGASCLTTLGLWDAHAASCAIAALEELMAELPVRTAHIDGNTGASCCPQAPKVFMGHGDMQEFDSSSMLSLVVRLPLALVLA